MNWPHVHLPVAIYHMVLLLTIFAGDAVAVQIQPNPNPDVNTITITPSTPAENLVPFSNLGRINIETLATFRNSSQFNNGSQDFSPSGADVRNSGTIINSCQFNNYTGVFTLQEGSRFNNLASGIYSGVSGSIGISGTFVNEGTVTHSLGYIVVGEAGQYIQRQAVGSSVTPTTVTPDAPFRNAGRVHIAAGDFNIDPISVRAASATYEQTSTGTTQVDSRLQNIGGTVRNAGAITIAATGEYRQQGLPGPILAGSTTNSGTFTNAGTTNIVTGTFSNNAQVFNQGAMTVGTTGAYNQSTPVPGGAPTVSTVNAGSFTNAGTVHIAETTGFSNSPGAQYVNQASGTTQIDGQFVNRSQLANEGAITVGTKGAYVQGLAAIGGIPPFPTTNSGTFMNAGKASIDAGTFINQGAVVNSGTWQIGSNSIGTFMNQGSTVNSGIF